MILDPQQSAALDLLQSGANVFLTGSAGTGKSTVTTAFVGSAMRKVDITATTGVAAINLRDSYRAKSGGRIVNVRTIYSFSGMGLGPKTGQSYESFWNWWRAPMSKSKLGAFRRIQALECLIIDEVSMLPGHTFGYLDYHFRKIRNDDRPFGGVQMVCVGDFLQLGPVTKDGAAYDWAFLTDAWLKADFKPANLTTVHRQDEADFIRLLNDFRVGRISAESQAVMKPRVTMFPPARIPRLMTHNLAVDKWNRSQLESLPGESVTFTARIKGDQEHQRDWLIKNLVTPYALELRPGARIMVTANLIKEGELVASNGTLGTLLGCDVEANRVEIETDDGRVLSFGPWMWDFDPQDEDSAKFYQIPLRLAWASTIHKCVSPDARMVLNDGRAPRLGAIKVGDRLKNGGEVLAIAHTQRPACRIETSMGYEIIASPEHRWDTPNGWVQTSDLMAANSCICITPGEVKQSEESRYAWWLGVTVGDGSYNDDYEGGIHFSTTRKTLGDKWSAISLELGFRKANWRSDGRGLHATSKPIREAIFEDGLEYVTANKKSVPNSVWLGGHAEWTSFLRGLFDTDGSVGRSFVVLTTTSERISLDVQNLLLFCGIISKRNKFPGVKKPYWQVRINAGYIRVFEKCIGFSDPGKSEKLAKCRPNRIIRRFNGTDRVVAFEDLGVTIPMIDIEVPAPHKVSFGPFDGHNSQGLTLDSAVIDIRSAREPGQAYVALSRVRSLAGLHLKSAPAGVVVSPAAVAFHEEIARSSARMEAEKEPAAELCDY